MKITKLHIKKHLRFKNFGLDFTYPKGHEKAGQALDKVCFIGQSGTGKTTLLEILRYSMSSRISNMKAYHNYDLKGISAENNLGGIERSVTIGTSGFLKSKWKQDGKIVTNAAEKQSIWDGFYEGKNIFLFFPADMNASFTGAFKQDGDFSVIGSVKKKSDQNGENNFFDFSKESLQRTWLDIFKEIREYQEKLIVLEQAVFKAVSKKGSGDGDEVKAALNERELWMASNPNPLEKLKTQFSPLLDRLHLEIKTDFEFKSMEDLQFVQIQTKNGEEVPYHAWSTGTKQLLLTFAPLLRLNTEDSIVFVDEPERSLYPDLQKDAVGLYIEAAPKAQFFFATHSPLILSSFDPWEIVELKFDDKGFVYQEDYLEAGKERHIDNYRFYPKFMRTDSILLNVFDMFSTGSEERARALTKAARLEKILEKMRREGKTDTPEHEAKLSEFIALSNKLGWGKEG